ncbi:MAG: polymorphic toxin type 47 domain-containing protein [Paludisphaera borealis]|uniref:polymorphic toxin type 47 domain-containing protein n=1 Tax=Paludisphaera borealis TaxID=1387353 RepID=UPI002840F9EC|nr:polymorphic toxin type 47 domain-containing protein [Paludisphaera borealis]MDR3618417.1 polymorphic toxin type 47 domain-containing protein [Paludisphaera borealis]
MREAKLPLNPDAVKAADQALNEKHPELEGRKLTMGEEDAALRKEWMDSYLAKGGAEQKKSSSAPVGATIGACPTKGVSKAQLRYKLGPNDVDWRGTGKTADDALSEAFSKTGLPPSEFKVTKWGHDQHGKSFPAEWRHPSGAEVNIDFPHVKNGPDAPHVGWQTGGKRGGGGAQRGHIILDDVPYNR